MSAFLAGVILGIILGVAVMAGASKLLARWLQ